MEEKKAINVLVNVNVSEDKQRAFITIGELKNGGSPLSFELLINTLKSAGVVYGINEKTVAYLVNSPTFNHQELVAVASQPEAGKNASVKYLFPVASEAAPKVLANGSVDFKELGIIKNVREGEPVCVKTPATAGVPGRNVLGDEIPAQAGRDVPLPLGKNTGISEDGLQLLSRINGQVDFVGNRVNVMKQFEIKENVDYNTGNIDFVGNVNIGGDVAAGFTVKAEGNVFIKGSIDGGTVIAKGNITVANGIKSNPNTKITCGGDLRCKFLQNANVDVDGNLESTSCINSIVHVGGVARFSGSQAMLLSSRVTAGKAVETLNIGSKSSNVSSIIEVGINPRIAERALQIPNEISAIKKKAEGADRLIQLFQQLEAKNRLTPDKKEQLDNLLATSQGSKQELLNLEQEQLETAERMKNLGFGTVKVFGTAYAGTNIGIGSEKKILASDYQFSQFVRTDEGITVSPAQR